MLNSNLILNLPPKKVFFVDGVGAFITACMLSLVLSKFESFFGMPLHVLYSLAAIAIVLAVCSFACHFINPTDWRPYLRFIAIANILYCIITVGMILFYREKLTLMGYAYFAGEILIILSLARLELKKTRMLISH